MGYRSDIYFHMTKAGYEFFKQQIPVDMWMKPDYEEIRDDYIYFNINSVKWYDGYADVASYIDALGKMSEEGYGFSFARLGEDTDDIELQSNLYWDGCKPKNDVEECVPEFYITRDVCWD